MASFVSIFDTQVTIYRRVGDGPAIGTKSKWDDTPFPATNKDIDGWHFDERRWGGLLDDNEAHFVPVLWDPSTVGITDNIETGIGDNNDLLVTKVQPRSHDFENVWHPQIYHGYYYSEDNEFYLHSDDGVIDYPTFSGLVPSGGNSVQLSHTPKPGVPLIARGYKWSESDGVYLPDRTIRKRTEFTGQFTASGELLAQEGNIVFWENVNTSQSEWFLDDSTNPPTAIFNQQIVEQVGEFYTSTSGLDQAEIDLLDTFGISNAQDNQQFTLKYSPIDRTSEVKIFSDFLGSDNRVYTEVQEFSQGGINEFKLDYDLGIVEFGTVASGGVPPYGSTLRAAYYKTVGIEYEPQNSRDYIEDVEANLNPVRRFTGDGFVFLRNRALDVSRLELKAVLPEITKNFFGPLLIGNSFASLQAIAYSKDNEVIEGQDITFEILSMDIGSFGASQTTTAVTNGRGEATTLYNPPRTIDQLGGITNNVITTASGSQLFLDDYQPASTDNALFLFQIAREDLVLGLPKSGLRNYYEDFLIKEGTPGPEIDFPLDLTENFAWLGSAVENQIKWEVWHREVHELATPITYEEGDLRTGKKSVIAELDTTAINPHTGDAPALVPVQPIGLTITESGTAVDFAATLSDITSSSLQKSYLVVGPTKVRLRAKTLNKRTNTVILSNVIEILIDIPDSAKGLLDIDTINSVPSGLLANAHFFDQAGTNLDPVELVESGLLPIGWRLRSPSITIASALDGVTILDLNPIPQSYTHDELTASGELLINLTHQFEVNI